MTVLSIVLLIILQHPCIIKVQVSLMSISISYKKMEKALELILVITDADQIPELFD
jgi:hypothetical protein